MLFHCERLAIYVNERNTVFSLTFGKIKIEKHDLIIAKGKVFLFQMKPVLFSDIKKS